jgi:hypothetical protein
LAQLIASTSTYGSRTSAAGHADAEALGPAVSPRLAVAVQPVGGVVDRDRREDPPRPADKAGDGTDLHVPHGKQLVGPPPDVARGDHRLVVREVLESLAERELDLLVLAHLVAR